MTHRNWTAALAGIRADRDKPVTLTLAWRKTGTSTWVGLDAAGVARGTVCLIGTRLIVSGSGDKFAASPIGLRQAQAAAEALSVFTAEAA